jgi:branched-chain amino acid transport system permease protein
VSTHVEAPTLQARRLVSPVGVVLLVVVGFAVPYLVADTFTISMLTDCLIYTVLALSYDLAVGRIGVLSLAHPAFFGTGAYTAAIAARELSLPIGLQVVFAVVTACLLALLVGAFAFRLSQLAFGMATLGFALIVQLIAVNQVGLTNGPLCISGLPPVASGSLRSAGFTTQVQSYYLFLILAVLVGIGIRVLVTSRIGRAYLAVREDEPMAMTAAINPLRYRMSAFVVGAGIAGLLGSFYAHHLSVVCPSNLDISYTINLLVIVFLGGAGGFWGIILAAFVFTVIPQWLQVTPQTRMLIYGVILLIGVSVLPDGIQGAVGTLRRRITRGRRSDDA